MGARPLPRDQGAAMFENLTLPTLPPMEVLTPCALGAAALAVILAACFSPFLAVASERLSVTRKRGFYAKAAQQIGQMNVLLAVAALALFSGGAAYAAVLEPALLDEPYFPPLAVTGGTAASAAVFTILYAALRPKKGGSGPVHILTGFLAGSLGAASLFLATGLVRRLAHTPPETDPALPLHLQLLDFFSIPLDSLFWPLLAEAVPLGFAFAAAFASVWLVLMRGRQDFGRDYYAFALPYCARWALTATLIAIALGAVAFFRGRDIMLPELSQLPSLLLDALSIILPLLACFFWAIISNSPHPMRHKISTVLALLLLTAGLAGQILMLNKIIPSP